MTRRGPCDAAYRRSRPHPGPRTPLSDVGLRRTVARPRPSGPRLLQADLSLTSRSVALDLEPELRGIAIALVPRNEEVLRSGRDESYQQPGRVPAHLEPVWQALRQCRV